MKIKISQLSINMSNGLEVIRHLFSKNLEMDVVFSLEVISNLIKDDTKTYIDKQGIEHHFPSNAVTMADSLNPFLEVKGDGEILAWEKLMMLTQKQPGYAKWMILAKLCDEGFACNSRILIDFLISLDGKETASFATILCCKEYLNENPYKNIVNSGIENLYSRLNYLFEASANKAGSHLDACSNFAFTMHNNRDDVYTVVENETFGLGLRVLSARHISELPQFLRNIANDFIGGTQDVSHPMPAPLKCRTPSDNYDIYQVIDCTFETLTKDFMDVYNSAGDENDIKNIVHKYSYAKDCINIHNCHVLTGINAYISGIDPKILPSIRPMTIFHLFDHNFTIDISKIDEYLNHWSSEIKEATALRRVFPVHHKSFFADQLINALRIRASEDFAFFSRTPSEYTENLKHYAALRSALMSRAHLMTRNLDHLENHEDFSENYQNENIVEFIVSSGLLQRNELIPDKLLNAFDLLPNEEQTIANKLFCSILLTGNELEVAAPTEKRQALVMELGI